MARLTVWVPDELEATVRAELPGVNVSKVVQEGLRALLRCKHERVVCEACNEEIDRRAIAERAKSELFTQLMWELEDLVHAGGTAEGAARLAKSVAIAHQVPDAGHRPLPRPSKAQHRRNADRRWLEEHNRRLEEVS